MYMYIYIAEISQPEKKHTHTHTSSLFKDYENTQLLPFHLKFENTTDWEAFQCLTGAANHIRVCVSTKSGESS